MTIGLLMYLGQQSGSNYSIIPNVLIVTVVILMANVINVVDEEK